MVPTRAPRAGRLTVARSVAAVAGLAAVLATAPALTSAAWTNPAYAQATVKTLVSSPPVVRIMTPDGSMCLDNRSNQNGNQTASAQQVTVRPCSTTVASQKWQLNWAGQIQTAGFGATVYCLDVNAEGTANGTTAIVYGCKTTGNLTNQEWKVQGTDGVGQQWATSQAGTPTGNVRCLSAPLTNGSVPSGTGVVLWTCGTTGYQQMWVVGP